MTNLLYRAGNWFGETVVLPFLDGLYDSVAPDLKTKIEGDLRTTISRAIPDWFEKLLKLRVS